MKTYGIHCGIGRVKLTSLLTALTISGAFPAYASSTAEQQALQQSYLLLDGTFLIKPGMRFIRGKDGPIDDTVEVTVRNSLEEVWLGLVDRPTMVPAIEIAYSEVRRIDKIVNNRREEGFKRTVIFKDGRRNSFEDYSDGKYSCILHLRRKTNEKQWACVTAIEGDVFNFSTGKTERRSLPTLMTDRDSSTLKVLNEGEARDAELSFAKEVLGRARSTNELQSFIQRYRNNIAADDLLTQAASKLYVLEFDSATGVGSLRAFINKYSANDPSGLIPKAKRKLYQAEFKDATTTLALQNFITKYQSDDPDGLVPQADLRMKSIAKNEAEFLRQKKVLEEKNKQQSVAIKQYQDRLKIGSLTNCGKVVGEKGGMLEIHHPLAGYGETRLIERHRLFPSVGGLFSCCFVNGKHQYDPNVRCDEPRSAYRQTQPHGGPVLSESESIAPRPLKCHDETVVEQHCEMRNVPGILHHYEMEQHCTPTFRVHTVCN